jgi:hypothetical protein
MKTRSLKSALSGFLMTILSAAACAAEDKPTSDVKAGDCFGVVMPKTGNAGSILIDRCTGKTWVLARITLREGYTLRWHPISVESNEYILIPSLTD